MDISLKGVSGIITGSNDIFVEKVDWLDEYIANQAARCSEVALPPEPDKQSIINMTIKH